MRKWIIFFFCAKRISDAILAYGLPNPSVKLECTDINENEFENIVSDVAITVYGHQDGKGIIDLVWRFEASSCQ